MFVDFDCAVSYSEARHRGAHKNFRMIHLKERRSLEPQISYISDLVLYLTVVLLLLTHFCGGQSQMIDQPQPIVAMLGDDTILPCHLQPAVDADSMTVEWARADLQPRFVHLRREGVELLIDQNPSYIGRTSLSISRLKSGDLTLTLSKVKLSDEGTYRCFIASQGKQEEKSVVELTVGSVSSPALRLSRLGGESSSVSLDCESKGWYPEPEVLWLDGEGNLLPAGPTETVRGPDDLYTVSSRVTVEKRHSNSFTCRVQQKNISQTRETEICITDDLFVVPSCSVGRIMIVLVVGFMCISAVVLILFKLARNKTETKMNRVEGTELADRRKKKSVMTRETEQFMAEEENKRDSERERQNLDEKLQKNDEELEYVHHMTETLAEQETELKLQKDKLFSLILKVTEEKEKLKTTMLNKDKCEKRIKDLDTRMTEHKDVLQHTKKLQATTVNMIIRLTKKKEKLEKQKQKMNKQLEET